MKVAIVGMLPRQEREIPVHQYRNLDIRFANKGRRYGLSESAVFAEADRIFVMTKFVSHSLTDNLDRSKTTLIHGGFGKLKDALHNLNAAAYAATTRAVLPTFPTTEEPDMAADKIDFKKAFQGAKVGDVLEITRPSRMTIKRFETQIALARSYYKRNKGIYTDPAEIKNGSTAHVIVTRVDGPGSAPVPPKPVITAQEAQEDQALVESPPPAVVVSAQHRGNDTLEFWTRVYLLHMQQNPATTANMHAEAANYAVDALLKKLG